jgi:hypothetical protein
VIALISRAIANSRLIAPGPALRGQLFFLPGAP